MIGYYKETKMATVNSLKKKALFGPKIRHFYFKFGLKPGTFRPV